MRFRTTLLLLLLLVGLGAYVLWVEMPKAEREAQKERLLAIEEDAVTEVALAYPDREIVVRKADDTWRMVKPVEAPADAIVVRNLVNAIAQAEVAKQLEDPGELASYGLEPPAVTVSLRLGDETPPLLLVGKATPIGFNVYVKKADAPAVMLVGGAFGSTLDKQVKDLRDKTILTFSDPEVRKIRLQGEGAAIVLAQQDGAWRVEEPASYEADAASVRNFLSSLRSLRSLDFPDESTDPAQYGLEAPRLTITLSLGEEGAEKTLRLGAENDKKEIYLQLAGQPTVYAVSDWVLRDLNKTANDFRDKTLLAFDRDAVRGLRVAGKQGTVKFVRGDDMQWQVEGADDKPNQATIDQYLTDLANLKGYEIAADQPEDLSAFGLDEPQLAVALSGEEERDLGTLLLGRREQDEKTEHTAMRAGATTVLLIRDYEVTRLDKAPSAFMTAADDEDDEDVGDDDLDDEDESIDLDLLHDGHAHD